MVLELQHYWKFTLISVINVYIYDIKLDHVHYKTSGMANMQ